MKATEILMNEHRIIERVLDALETAAARLESGEAVRPEYFLDAADFIAGFADGCHHRKEEGVLFVELAASGMPPDQGPVAVMLDEHERGRAFTRAIRAAARRLAEGDTEARRALVTNTRGYVALLRDHIAKEDEVLFPMADQLIPPDRHDQVLAGFARVEHLDAGPGAHQKFLDLAERLTAPWLSPSGAP
ncbi:MAG TPA: hemerythrin domain-containing protein [Gemmatimonadales bacterium]